MTFRQNSSNVNPTTQPNADRGLMSALRMALRPIVRLMIRNGIAERQFHEVLRLAYYDAAANDFPIEGKRLSASRIAILTGFSRKEVSRLARLAKGDALKEGTLILHRAAAVLAGWHTDERYLDDKGAPVRVPFSANDDEVSFCELVAEYSTDMSPRAMLDELLRVSAVAIAQDGDISVLKHTYMPDLLDSAGVAHFGQVVHDLVATLDHNLNPHRDRPNHFERRVYASRGVPVSRADEFRELVAKHGMDDFLRPLDSWITKVNKESRHRDEERVNIGVNAFYWEGEPEVNPPPMPGGSSFNSP